MPPEYLLHRRLPRGPRSKTVVHENARQLIADGLVQQRRRDARINPAAQAENHALSAHLPANFLDGLIDVAAHRPVAPAAADVVNEVRDKFLAARALHDLRMKLQTEHLFPAMSTAA